MMDQILGAEVNYSRFGPVLKSNIEGMQKIIKSNQDWIMLLIGYEKIGKSTLALEIAKTVDPDFDTSMVCFTASEFKMALEKAKRCQAIIVDEGVEAFFTRKTMSRESVDTVVALTEIGHKNLFIIVCAVDPLMVDKYVFAHRARCLIRITDRGRYEFYSKKQMMKIRKNPDTKMTEYSHPNFTEFFSHIDDTPLFGRYYEKKEAFINSNRSQKVWKNRMKQEAKMKKSYTFQDIAVMNGANIWTVRSWAYNQNVFRRKDLFRDIFGRIRVTEKGYEMGMKKLLKMRNRRRLNQKIL